MAYSQYWTYPEQRSSKSRNNRKFRGPKASSFISRALKTSYNYYPRNYNNKRRHVTQSKYSYSKIKKYTWHNSSKPKFGKKHTNFNFPNMNIDEKHRCDVCKRLKVIEDVTVRSNGDTLWVCKK